MGTLSLATFKRIYTVVLVGTFPQGAFGAIRVQKTNYHVERQAALRPFAVYFHHHGQYSQGLSDTVEQLLSMSCLAATPLGQRDENDGNRYWVRDRATFQRCREVLGQIDPTLPRAVESVVRSFGMMRQDELLRRSYEFLEGYDRDDLVLDANAPTQIGVSSLTDEECDDLEMGLSPVFVQNVRALATAMSETEPDWAKVRGFGGLQAHRA